jgi:regulator of protease activity HflC (stomatin/prohibitin superfamily)
MAEIACYPVVSSFLRHTRTESSVHVLHQASGRVVRSGRGLAFWFAPMQASISELPMDDRELPILFHARSREFQDVTVQAVVTWRVKDPEVLASRVDFTVDLASGQWRKQPLEKLGGLVTELAQQLAWDVIGSNPLQTTLATGPETLRQRLGVGLAQDATLQNLGIEIVSVRITGVQPGGDISKALQTPAREAIQQEADKATFERRALAVERERAIAENELRNRIELAKRAEELINQEGANARSKAEHTAKEGQIASQAAAERKRTEDTVAAEGIRMIEKAKVEAEASRMDVYKALEPGLLQSLALRELAANVPDIEHLSLGADAFSSVLTRLAEAGTSALSAK